MKQLCDWVAVIKEQRGLTYDKIVEICDGGIHKSQLVSILKNEGKNVSVTTIADVIEALGGEIEVSLKSTY